jgi:hypothetical protein
VLQFVHSAFFDSVRAQWEVRRIGDGTYEIKNLKSQTYLSFEGVPEVNKPVGGYPEPRTWSLYQAAEPFTFQ